jgi:hypothetical protein
MFTKLRARKRISSRVLLLNRERMREVILLRTLSSYTVKEVGNKKLGATSWRITMLLRITGDPSGRGGSVGGGSAVGGQRPRHSGEVATDCSRNYRSCQISRYENWRFMCRSAIRVQGLSCRAQADGTTVHQAAGPRVIRPSIPPPTTPAHPSCTR